MIPKFGLAMVIFQFAFVGFLASINDTLAWNNHNMSPNTDRRRFLIGSASTSTSSAAAMLLFTPNTAQAVSPINAATETESRLAQLQRKLRPVQPLAGRSLRQPIAIDFAVLLLRSSYNACDTLDVIPMPQFQRDFFLIRSAEYQYYLQQSATAAVRQGDVTDANYFDALSLAQYKTIARAVAQPAPAVFEEDQPIDDSNDTNDTPQRFQTVVVRRSHSDAELVPLFDRLVGDSILQWMDDRYKDTPIGVPLQSNKEDTPHTTPTTVYNALQQLVKLFVLNGFAWDGRVVMSPTTTTTGTTTYRLILETPATAYASRVLAWEQSVVSNDFLGKTALAWLRRQSTTAVVQHYRVQLDAKSSTEETLITVAMTV